MRYALATLLLVMLVMQAGCDGEPESGRDAERRAALLLEGVDEEPRASTQNVAAIWVRSCALCHVDGNGGAPRAGIAEDWEARVTQGEAMLLLHTVEGYANMPPLGYCMDCTRADFLALIRMMTPVETR